jgi:hypothetical protein
VDRGQAIEQRQGVFGDGAGVGHVHVVAVEQGLEG